MYKLLPFAAALSLGCVVPPSSIPIWVSSRNRSEVDVYLLCGDQNAERLGVVPPKEAGLFEIPVSRARCARGLNFFLVLWDLNRGYWVGPLRPRSGLRVHLTIEKYAGLSSAQLLDDRR